ncbi:MAG: hypothetical protein IJ455_02670 [Agathobacter sp.]|nr:hypothetical protein [Agathobacter sp.]
MSNIFRELLAQKNRNRAIDITDVAISKVPKTHIYGFSNEQNTYIQALHRELLKEAQKLNKEYHTNLMEVGILLDIHTWDYWKIKGKKDCTVDIKESVEAFKVLMNARKNQLMMMHNHPSTGTFSGEDFKTFCNNDAIYMMTVVGNDASVYILVKMKDFDKKVLAEYAQIAQEYYELGYKKNNGTMAMKHILKNASKYGIEYKKGRNRL